MGRIAFRRTKTNKPNTDVAAAEPLVDQDQRKNNTIVQQEPSIIYYDSGQLASREYFLNGVSHREPSEGPAYECWYENGQHTYKQYFTHGQLHRDPKDGPAVECWFRNGNINYREFRIHGKAHRDPRDGPAIESWLEDGTREHSCFYLDGQEVQSQQTETISLSEKQNVPSNTHQTSGKIIATKVIKNLIPVKKLNSDDMKSAIEKRKKDRDEKSRALLGMAIFEKDGLFVNAYDVKTQECIDTFSCGSGKVTDLINSLLDLIVFFNNHKSTCYFDLNFEDDELPEEVLDPYVETGAEWLERMSKTSKIAENQDIEDEFTGLGER